MEYKFTANVYKKAICAVQYSIVLLNPLKRAEWIGILASVWLFSKLQNTQMLLQPQFVGEIARFQ